MRLREKQHPHGSTERKWNGRENDERIDPTLKVDHQKQKNQHDGQGHSGEQARITLFHGLYLTTEGYRNSLGSVLPDGVNNLDNFRGRGIQIASLHISVHIKNWSDVELRHDHRHPGPTKA